MPGKKLLVADDSLTIQKVIRLALSNEGYEIQAVADGNDAIQQISLFRPDLVLIDVSLPGKSAFEVKREINQHSDFEETRFVLMSSAFEKVDEDQIEEVQFHGRLTKPFDPAHLRQVLTDVLAQVTAKRMEKTSLLQRPDVDQPPPPPSMPSFPKMEDLSIFPPPAPESSLPSFAPPPPLPQADDWNSPLSPNEPPILPPPMQDPVQELWEASPPLPPLMPSSGGSELKLTPPPPPFGPETPAEEEDDPAIRELTESTLHESYNDWRVSEPTLKPPAGMMDNGGSHFELDRFPPALPPSMEEPLAPAFKQPPPPISIPEPELPPDDDAPAVGISSKQVEAIVRIEVQNALEKFAEKLLPELAEKVIKNEIHKLLSE